MVPFFTPLMICAPCPAPGRLVCGVIRRFLSYLVLFVSGRGSVEGLEGRWREAVEADLVEDAVFESVMLSVGSGRPWEGKWAGGPEGMGAVPCTLCHSVGKSGRRVQTGSDRLTAER
jgi:hypothetical protein